MLGTVNLKILWAPPFKVLYEEFTLKIFRSPEAEILGFTLKKKKKKYSNPIKVPWILIGTWIGGFIFPFSWLLQIWLSGAFQAHLSKEVWAYT